MRIPEQILAECHAHGVEAYPEESCGFIVGNLDDAESLETVHPMRNIMNELHEEDPEQYPRTGRDGYMIDPREHMKLERSLKKEGKQIKVIYHSHPDVGAYFSEKDKEDALWNGNARYPGITFLVCATNQGKAGDAILVDFNTTESDFDITKIPEITPVASSELLGGTFGISGLLPTLDFIHEWKNGKTELEYGYFRFVPPKQVRTFQQQLAVRHQARHGLAYSSGRSSLLELLSYLQDSSLLTNLHLAPSGTFITDALLSLEILPQSFNLNELPDAENFSANEGDVILIVSKNSIKFFRENGEWLGKFKRLRVPVIVYEETASRFWQADIQYEWPIGLSYWIRGFTHTKNRYFDCGIAGGIILSNNDRQMAELLELRKRRGAVLSARNAELFCEKSSVNVENSKSTSEYSEEVETEHGCVHEEAVTKQLCAWENAAGGLLFPSGMAAIMAVLTLLQKKEKPRLIVIGLLYSETYSLLMDSRRFTSYEAVFIGLHELDRLAEVLTKDTAMVITETITNPLCGVPDLERIGKLANAQGVPFVVDNTLASPVNCQPVDWGADYVIHSTTKYLSGTNDHAGGAVLVKCPEKAKDLEKFQQNWELEISPLETEVLQKRMLDFEERMQRFNENSLAVAHFLEAHSAVNRVYYACSPSDVSSSAAPKLLSGNGGVVSFVLKNDTEDNLRRFYDGEFTSIFKAPTLGSNETLVCPYSLLTHYHDSDEDLLEIELPRHLIRIASGSENEIEPIIADLNSALARTTH
ncbi:MAG: PLP-dependent transferase [SAR324 cluster bacterium]|nr:PLP-dependent transferase [SAR324 cluster bacterium]